MSDLGGLCRLPFEIAKVGQRTRAQMTKAITVIGGVGPGQRLLTAPELPSCE